MGGARVRLPLALAALATGGAFSVLFTGETYDGFEGGFGASSLMNVLGGGAFLTMTLAALVAVLVGSAGGYRFVLVFPAAVVYAQFAVYGWPPMFSIEAWREHFMRIGADVYAAAETMYVEPIPYDLAPGLFVVLIPVVVIVVAFATSATLYEESPVFSVAVLGLTIGVLSTISFEDGAGPFFFVFLVSAMALLLSYGGPRSLAWPGIAAGAAVVVVVLALPKGPFADQTVSSGIIDWTRIGTGGTSQLDVQADVGDYLTYGREAELMRVRSSEPLLWRGGTLDYFDGVRWSDTTEMGEDYGEEIAPGVPTRLVQQDVQILDAQTDRIFGGYRIVTTSLEQDDVEQGSDGSWFVDRPLSEGSTYRVLSEVPQPTEAQLLGAGTSYPAEIEEKFLQLSDDTPGVVAETADRIESNYPTGTPYERALAIEQYLLYDGDFVYNLDVSYRRADEAIEEFLGDGREGFCTQFATSMALIAREMGVPSRVVYGSTSGEEVEEGEYVVTGANMHTWVELYFPGVGWYPFDPTPGFSVPATMQANAPRPEVSSLPQGLADENRALNERGRESEQAREQSPEEQAGREGRDPGSSGGPALPWFVYALLPVALVAAVPLVKRALASRGRPEDLYRDLSGRLRDVLPPGGGKIADSPALTPTERMVLLAGAAGVEEGPFEEFARAYSEHLYSGDAPRGTRSGSNRRVSAAYRRAVRSYEVLPLWRRALGGVNPASLLARAGRSIAALRTGVRKRLRGKLRAWPRVRSRTRRR